MDFPDDLYYTENHEWLRVDEDGMTATIGITDFAQRELGDIVFVEIDPEGTEIAQEDVFGTIEAVKTVSELFMPVDGTITAINDALDAAPETVNQDAYGDGWLVEIEMADPDQLDRLLRADAYADLV